MLLRKDRSNDPAPQLNRAVAIHPSLAMSVRVVARIRPLLKGEIEKDIIIRSDPGDDGSSNVVRIPNPKNQDEDFTFQFNEVYYSEATQEEIFQSEGMLYIFQLDTH